MTSPALVLHALAGRYRMTRAVSRVAIGIAGGIALAGLLRYAGATAPGIWLGLVSGSCLGALAAWAGERRRPVTGALLARHLDRALPELEESASLLLEDKAVSGLGALQRRRVASRFDPGRARAALPRAEQQRALRLGLPLAAAGMILFALPPATRSVGWISDTEADGRALTLKTLGVEIAPPAYTGLPAREAQASDLEAEEGATLHWRLLAGGPLEHARLVFSNGDSAAFTRTASGAWEATTRAERSTLFRVQLAGADSLALTSDDYRLAVRPDRPPLLTVVKPEPRTVVDPKTLPPVDVEVLANDDYGVASAGIAATIASGRGEAVRFRRLRLPFTSRTARAGHGELLRATLDLRALKLGAGDELYFEVEATDRRTPVPNRSRSETMFITVRDSAEVAGADVTRLALGVQPEYFRSQRQLIIDTEKLLADQPKLARAVFQQRSNELGMDQGLLRLRYGQFLGEEFEEELQPMGGREHAAQGTVTPDRQEAPKAGDEAKTTRPETDPKKTEKKAIEGLEHRHDDAENATLLGRSVKDKLREAVGAMWKSELKLRTHEPRAALPYMYQALELIKQVQQDARVYVQRVGFEPPPIEVDRLRLTGKLKDIADTRLSHTFAARDTLPATRRALALLSPAAAERLAGKNQADRAELATALAAAGQELARIAVDDPALLPLLRDLRQLTDSVDCLPCRAQVRAGFWRALPPAEPRLETEPAHDSPLARRFGALLRSGRR